MRRQLIIIGKTASVCRESLETIAVSSDLVCDVANWDQLDRLNSRQADMVVLVGVSEHDEMAAAFDSLRRNPLNKPTLAVLPEAAEPGLIVSASDSVDEFVLAPIHVDEFALRINRVLGPPPDGDDSAALRILRELPPGALVGRDRAFLRTVSRLPVASRTNSPVLIVGETGTGKEVFARAIHSLSSRRDRAFIPVDCASIPDHLFENELFGHVRGAFTDARAHQKGLVGMAQGGTLFLDEIDSLSLGAQSKLLRFLQERTYRPLGADQFLGADVKLVTATNKDIDKLSKSGDFRPDLLFRINVLRTDLPPLRQRPADIAPLARHFVAAVCAENGMASKVLTPGALRKLEAYSWPGNIRELHNVIQRSVLYSEGMRISLCKLDCESGEEAPSSRECGFREERARALESFERRYVEDLMRRCNGNVSQAARIAKKERRSFGRLVKRYQGRQQSNQAQSSL